MRTPEEIMEQETPKNLSQITNVFDSIEHNEVEECVNALKQQLEQHFSREIMEIIMQIIHSRVGTLVEHWEAECEVEFSSDSLREILKRVENWIVEELQEVRLPQTWWNNSFGIW